MGPWRYCQELVFEPTAKFTDPFRFLHLPFELRDEIYDEVWPSTGHLEHSFRKEGRRQLELHIHYHNHEAPPGIKRGKGNFALIFHKKHPEWLLVNKHFLGEASSGAKSLVVG
jgi:hypothetical protein